MAARRRDGSRAPPGLDRLMQLLQRACAADGEEDGPFGSYNWGGGRVRVLAVQTEIVNFTKTRTGGLIQLLTADTPVYLSFRPGLNSIAGGTFVLVNQGDAIHFDQTCQVYRGPVYGIVESAEAVVGVLEETSGSG